MVTVYINPERDAAEGHTGPTEYRLSLEPQSYPRSLKKKPMKKS